MIANRSQRGMVMIAALVIVGLTGLIAAVCAQQLLQTHRQARREASVRQAQWLAEGALERALVRLAADEKYAGETWQTELSLKEESPTGEATIRVTSAPGAANQKQIEIDVQFPVDPSDGVRYQIVHLTPSAQADP